MPAAIWVTGAQKKTVIGRSTSCDVALPLLQLSKTHLVLHVLDNTAEPMLFVEDISSNGTWVNGSKMTKDRKTQVNIGDRISLLPPSASVRDMHPLAYDVAAGANGHVETYAATGSGGPKSSGSGCSSHLQPTGTREASSENSGN